MEVTKCDRCGAYVDKCAGEMPMLIYSYSGEKYMAGDRVVKNICYNCYAELEKWLDVDEEDKDANND